MSTKKYSKTFLNSWIRKMKICTEKDVMDVIEVSEKIGN